MWKFVLGGIKANIAVSMVVFNEEHIMNSDV